MKEKAIDNNSSGCLILILPIALAIIFLFATWPILLGTSVLILSLNAWQRHQWQEWSRTVNPIFNQLILDNRGGVTPLDLAIKANFSAQTAKRYLDSKAEEFGAQCRNLEQGPMYYFITASTLGSIFDDSEPQSRDTVGLEGEAVASDASQLAPTVLEGHQIESLTQVNTISIDEKRLSASLIQAELAKRLEVHSSTVYKRREDPDFAEWSQSRDPEGIAWKYIPATREFEPLPPNPQLQ